MTVVSKFTGDSSKKETVDDVDDAINVDDDMDEAMIAMISS